MDYNRKISERFWNLPEKGELESKREQTFIDDIIQKSHIERALSERLSAVNTVFDAGAGSGRFSIFLAKKGLHVVHFDISQSMITKAKELAEQEGVLSQIEFVQGALEDLSEYEDKSFDLVISIDSPISYTYPKHESVIASLVRIAKKKVIFSVSSRLGSLPYLANPLQKHQFILDKNSPDSWVQWLLKQKSDLIDQYHFNKKACDDMLQTGLMGNVEAEVEAYKNGQAPWPITYAFMPDELTSILAKNGVTHIELAGPGAFARTIPNELLVKIMNDPGQKAEFLDFCYQYDRNPYVCGLGKDNLLACGEIEFESE
jgi:ubiquinone/menaquinone biosynthesis C-methylase UbiE